MSLRACRRTARIVSGLLCQLTQLLSVVVNAYTIVLFVYAIISWLPDLRGPWVRYLAALVEPVLAPVRRIVPPMGGFDLAFLVVILLLQFVVRPGIAALAAGTCLP